MLRGYYFGEKLNKQNGHHWFADGGEPTPPTPSAILIGSTLLTVMGGYRARYGSGMSVISHDGKPFFKPFQHNGWAMSEFDPHINTGGNRHNDYSYYDNGAGFGGHLDYIGAVMYYFYYNDFNISAENQALITEKLQTQPTVTTRFTFKPHHTADTVEGELERNLCLPESFGSRPTYSADPSVKIVLSPSFTANTDNIIVPAEKILLNNTNLPDIQPTQSQTITYREGYRVGEGLVLEGITYGYTPQSVFFNFWEGLFTFPYDYYNNNQAEYLQLDIEVTIG